MTLPQSLQSTTNHSLPVLGFVALYRWLAMKVLRLVLRHMGRRADFSRVRIAPSVMPVVVSLMPRFMYLDVGQDVFALVYDGVCLFIVRS
jgi:hypothetical protein